MGPEPKQASYEEAFLSLGAATPAETSIRREDLQRARDDRRKFHAETPVDELIDHYAPSDIDPRDWPDMWFKTFEDETIEMILKHRRARVLAWNQAMADRKDRNSGKFLSVSSCNCGGTGWIVGSEKYNPQDELAQFGRIIPCSCQNVDKAKRLWNVAGLPPDGREARQTIANFKPADNGDLQLALEECVAWAQEQEPEWVMLMGTTGTGKTHLARAAVAAVLWQEKPAKYIEAVDFREQFGNPTDDVAMAALPTYMHVEFLAIDDVGREYVTPFSIEKLHRVLNYRADRHMKTLLTTNHNEAELEEIYGAPLFSRMMRGSVLVIEGKDMRLG